MGRPCLCVQRASGQVNGALVSSREHSVSLFFSVRSLTLPVNLSLSVSFSFLSPLKLFPAVSIYFHRICRCLTSPSLPAIQCVLSHFFFLLLLCLLVFFQPLSLSLSLPLFAAFSISSLCLSDSVGEDRTDLFKISKDRSGGLAGPSPSANSPSLLLTDKQKSEPAGLAAVYCLPSLLYPSLFSSRRGVAHC